MFFLTFSALATFDSAFLLTISINKGMVSFGKVTPHCNFFLYPITNAIRKFAYTNSIYTIVALAFERYLSICHREKAKWLCSTSKAKLLIKTITILSFVYTIPIFCEHTWEKDENGTIRAVKTILRTKGPVRDVYYPVYRTWANFFVLFIIPTLSLMILNTLTIKKVTFFHQCNNKPKYNNVRFSCDSSHFLHKLFCVWAKKMWFGLFLLILKFFIQK